MFIIIVDHQHKNKLEHQAEEMVKQVFCWKNEMRRCEEVCPVMVYVLF